MFWQKQPSERRGERLGEAIQRECMLERRLTHTRRLGIASLTARENRAASIVKVIEGYTLDEETKKRNREEEESRNLGGEGGRF